MTFAVSGRIADVVVEELEREYFSLNNLDMQALYSIRKGLAD